MSAPTAASALDGGERSPRRTPHTIRLTHLDGKQPNLALMKLAAYHRALGDRIVFTRNAQRDLFEPNYDRVYGSAIFTRSAPLVARLQTDFPGAIVGGTGTDSTRTVEDIIGGTFDYLDYSLYPTRSVRGRTVPEHRSFGFVSRGCRFRCAHCVVPRKEGVPRASGTIADIYRGADYPKQIVLLDNDFFGVEPNIWRARIAELRDGNYRVSFNQGINVRVLSREQADAIASVRYANSNFTKPTLYTAFDTIADERVFRRGIEQLLRAGVRGRHIVSYMLIGYDDAETWDSIFRRVAVMREYGILPYPMPYQSFHGAKAANAIPYRDLKAYQRYIVRRHYHRMTWEEYRLAPEGPRRHLNALTRSLFDDAA